MKYIIVDLEATCWENKDQKKINEIIEIGAVCINENKEIESEFNEFIKPVLDPELSKFCTELTSITQKNVDTAETFDKVIERFKKWIKINEEFILCSWGFYDQRQFTADCHLHKTDPTWLKKHVSLKHQYAEIKKLSRPIGMAGALKMEKLYLEGTHHRGIDDARNIAKIFLKNFKDWKV